MPALPTHGRFKYSAIVDRPDFCWPDGKRLALYVAVNAEHFSYNEDGLGLSYSPGLDHPNTYNWAWRDYGNRVGGFRIADLLDQYGIAPTVLLNTAAYEHAPALMDRFRGQGAEFVAHGRTNSIHPNGLDEDAERAIIDETFAKITHYEGHPPQGWMSPGANPSAITEDLLAERGFRYTLDWPMDDQPVWLNTRTGPLLSVPYPMKSTTYRWSSCIMAARTNLPIWSSHHSTRCGNNRWNSPSYLVSRYILSSSASRSGCTTSDGPWNIYNANENPCGSPHPAESPITTAPTSVRLRMRRVHD